MGGASTGGKGGGASTTTGGAATTGGASTTGGAATTGGKGGAAPAAALPRRARGHGRQGGHRKAAPAAARRRRSRPRRCRRITRRKALTSVTSTVTARSISSRPHLVQGTHLRGRWHDSSIPCPRSRRDQYSKFFLTFVDDVDGDTRPDIIASATPAAETARARPTPTGTRTPDRRRSTPCGEVPDPERPGRERVPDLREPGRDGEERARVHDGAEARLCGARRDGHRSLDVHGHQRHDELRHALRSRPRRRRSERRRPRPTSSNAPAGGSNPPRPAVPGPSTPWTSASG
jgi:hypothetical protein